MVNVGQKILYGDLEFCCNIFVPDIGKLAESFSMDHYKCAEPVAIRENLAKAINNYRANNASAIVEIVVDIDDVFPIKPRAVKFVSEVGNAAAAGASPFLMKAFKRMLREKV